MTHDEPHAADTLYTGLALLRTPQIDGLTFLFCLHASVKNVKLLSVEKHI